MARYLSRAELSCIAGKYIEMYYALFGISKNDPAPINPEQFANSVLGLNLKMLPLCSDGHILGLTVFQRSKVFYNHFNKKRSCQFYTGKSVSCVIQKYRQG